MENKYYTPSIEEFHVGFECEWQCKIRKETWNKQICDQDLVNIAYSTQEHADEEEPFSEQFRVKYIDREDVESFGFVYDSKSNRYEYSVYYISGQLCYQNLTIVRYGEDAPMGNWVHWEDTIFEGKIKNKSQLSRLLKQLSII